MNFDRIAPIYRLLEYATFGPLLWKTRIYYLHKLTTSRRILTMGGGDGRFLAQLLKLNPYATVDYYDSSARMLEIARSRNAQAVHRVQFHHADLTQSKLPPNTYDAIAAHFFLDCFNDQELTSLLASLTPCAKPDCLWLISEFNIPSTPFPRLIAKLLTRALYLCFAFATGLKTKKLPNYQAALEGAGLTLEAQQPHLSSLLLSQSWRSPSTPKSAINGERVEDLHKKWV